VIAGEVGDSYHDVAGAAALIALSPIVSAAVAGVRARRWRPAAIAFLVSGALSVIAIGVWIGPAGKLCGDRIDCPR
jgi:hypothetical protein